MILRVIDNLKIAFAEKSVIKHCLICLFDRGLVMARVTVEDCAEVVRSRFELVALAAQRAKVISAGGEITVSRDNDKNAVIALREIADKAVDADALREQVIQARQTQVNVDEYGVEESDDEAESASYSAGESLVILI